MLDAKHIFAEIVSHANRAVDAYFKRELFLLSASTTVIRDSDNNTFSYPAHLKIL